MTNRNEYRWILSIAAFLAMIFPFLSVFNKDVMLLGVPLLYFYVFVFWGLMIYMTYKLNQKSS